jgi:hypothetical protein
LLLGGLALGVGKLLMEQFRERHRLHKRWLRRSKARRRLLQQKTNLEEKDDRASDAFKRIVRKVKLHEVAMGRLSEVGQNVPILVLELAAIPRSGDCLGAA